MKKMYALVLVMLMVLSMAACGVQQKENDATASLRDMLESMQPNESNSPSEGKKETQASSESQTQAPAEIEETEPEATEKPTEPKSDKIDADFKEAMDDYEEFMDDYVAFMKKYQKNPSDLSLLTDYAKFMGKYADFVEDFEKWEDEDLNAAETAYYIDVQARVTKKLLEVAQ